MSFRRAVEQTPHLDDAWRGGLGALRGKDRPHIQPADPRRLRGSVDVDSALQPHEPHANRWDYAIGYHQSNPPGDCIYWVEIHTASDSEVNVVLAKFQWLKAWLAQGQNLLRTFEREFIWISSGSTSFTQHSPQSKRLAASGLRHTGTILKILNKR